MGRVDRQVATLQTKIDRLEAMIAEALARRAHLENHLAEIDAGAEPTPHAHESRR
jgi:chorismate mutase